VPPSWLPVVRHWLFSVNIVSGILAAPSARAPWLVARGSISRALISTDHPICL